MTPPGSHGDATAELWFEGHQASSPPSLGGMGMPLGLSHRKKTVGAEGPGPKSAGILAFSLLGEREDVVLCWPEP